METNELPEDVKRKIEEAAKKARHYHCDGYGENEFAQFSDGAYFGYRLGLQSCQEQLKEMELKWQVDKSGVLNFTSNLAKRKKDEEILKLTDNVEKLLLQFKKDGASIDSLIKQLKAKDEEIVRLTLNIKVGEDLLATIDSLNKENERLRELQKEIWSLWESMAECGELSMGPKFLSNYERLKSLLSPKN